MVVQYCSDLHLEFKENQRYIRHNPLLPVGEVLVLAGDIGLFSALTDYNDFFDYISANFKVTYWVPGNHEYYYSNIAERSGVLHESIRHNVFLVNNCAIELEGARFLFSTLWSKISFANEWRIMNGLSDFQVIRRDMELFSPAVFNELHEECLAFLQAALSGGKNDTTVVVSHHVPTFQHYPQEYRNSPFNEAFAVELLPLIEKDGPAYWLYGHHHRHIPVFTIGRTNLLTNQLGYVQQNEHQPFVADAYFII